MKAVICKQINKDEIFWLTEENRLKLLRQQMVIVVNTKHEEWTNGLHNKILDWCDSNCSDIYYNDENCFYFLNQNDMLAFKMRWTE